MEEEEKEKVEVINYAHLHIRAPFLFLPREAEKQPRLTRLCLRMTHCREKKRK